MHCCICGRCRGDPLYEKDATMGEVIENAARELQALQEGGVDGVLIANEFSLPYEKKVSYVTVAAMGRVVGELKKEIKVPFGVILFLIHWRRLTWQQQSRQIWDESEL